MRITGGRWRGRRLSSDAGRSVRPTTDRVREALFNLLRDEIEGARVADCCCGTGALGIEALSRGAREVDFVDIAPAALRTVRANLERCGADPGCWRLHRSDAARWLRRALAGEAPPTVVLADPPYAGPVPEALLEAVVAGPPPTVTVLEHEGAVPPFALDADRFAVQTRRYGSSALTLIRPRSAGATEALDD
ncbi:16S rRNA (guanine(966)-N(2))-methyltransferase RsmD [bacterium]|nr:16S rRNA (guanine(966)-N(2))-methyltransferase RsmD [bacterium]